DFSSDEAFEVSKCIAEDELRIRTGDVRFVLDHLERLDQSDPTGLLTGHLDTSRGRIFGHAFGGAVAAGGRRLDSRCRSGIDLDGCPFGESAAFGVEQPFLFMSSDGSPPTPSELANSTGERHRFLVFMDQDARNVRHSLATYGGYMITIGG